MHWKRRNSSRFKRGGVESLWVRGVDGGGGALFSAMRVRKCLSEEKVIRWRKTGNEDDGHQRKEQSAWNVRGWCAGTR